MDEKSEWLEADGLGGFASGAVLQRVAAGADTPGFPTKWVLFDPKIVTSFLYALFVAKRRERKIHNFNIFMPLIREVPRARELLNRIP